MTPKTFWYTVLLLTIVGAIVWFSAQNSRDNQARVQDEEPVDQTEQVSEEPIQPSYSDAFVAGYNNNLGLSLMTKSNFGGDAMAYCTTMQQGMHSDLTGKNATDYVAGCIEAWNSGN
jgi:hypothetical protein